MPYRIARNNDRFKLNANSWQAKGIVGWWPIGAYPDARDLSRFGNDGSRVGDLIVSASMRRSLLFSGSTQYIDVGNAPALGFERTDPFSFSFWANKDTTTTKVFFGKRVSNAGYVAYHEFGGGVHRVRFAIRSSTGKTLDVQTSTNTLTTAVWSHIAITYDGSSSATGVHIYENGVEKALTTNTDTLADGGVIVNAGSFYIARDQSDTTTFDGQLDHFLCYRRVLLPKQVKVIFNETRDGSYGDLAIVERRVSSAVVIPPSGNRRRRLLCGA